MTRHFGRRYRASLDALYFRARMVSILFYLAGGWLVGRWSGDLFGRGARYVAAGLWCFHPLVLAHASVATPDLGATVLAAASLFLFAAHLRAPSWRTAVLSGVTLGLAELAKFTLVALYPAYLTIWLVRTCLVTPNAQRLARECGLFGVMVALSLLVLPFGYGCRGLGVSCDQLELNSHTLRAASGVVCGTPLRHLTVIVPRGYLEGLDQQALDVDGLWVNYFCGEQSSAGWSLYYPAVMVLKTPEPVWIVGCLALVAAWRGVRGRVDDELCLLLMPFLVGGFMWASPSLTFMRYLLPLYPPVLISLSRVGGFPASARLARCAVAISVSASVLAGVVRHPHYLGYFNLASGGASACWAMFSDSEVDWGQDLHALRGWQLRNPAVRPMRLVLFSPFPIPYSGFVDDNAKPTATDAWPMFVPSLEIPVAPDIGYLAISVTLLNRGAAATRADQSLFAPARHYLRWLKETRHPMAMIGTSILVYHLTERDEREWETAKQSLGN